MKQLFFLAVLIVIICTVSCQKEITETLHNGVPVEIPVDTTTPVAGSGLLIKEVTLQGISDSSITSYSYDINDRLQTINTIFYSGSGTSQETNRQGRRFYRDQAGRITMIAVQNAGNDPTGEDSTYTAVYYEGSSSHVSYTLLIKPYMDKMRSDSTVYSYSPGGNVNKKQHYTSSDWPFETAVMTTGEIYESDADNNLVKVETYSFPATPGVDSLQFGMYYTYDTKVNAYSKGEYADPVGFLTGKNNPLTQTIKYLSGTVFENSNYYSTYVYGAGDKPVSRINGSVTDTSNVTQTHYYYR